MASFETLVAAWAMLSGLAIAVLGLASIRGGRSRPWGAMPLGLFAIVWGINLISGNAARIVDDVAFGSDLVLISLVTLFPLPYFLIEFARQQTQDPDLPAWQAARVLTAGLAFGSVGLFIFQPELFLLDVQDASSGGLFAVWGPMWVLLKVAFFGALGVTLLALVRGLRQAPTPRVGLRAGLLTAGFGLYVGYAAGFNAASFTRWLVTFETTATNLIFACLFLALSAAVVYAAVVAGQRRPDGWPAGGRRATRGIQVALLAPLIWGVLEASTLGVLAPRLDTAGLWRLAGIGVLAYGLARWRIFDLPQRARRAAASSAGATGALAGGATAYGMASVIPLAPVFAVLGGLLFTGISWGPAVKTARRLLGVDPDEPDQDEEVLYGQRLDAYRAALEASIARGTLEQDEPFLEALRERFGIGQEGDQVLRHFAKQAVVLPSDRTVDQAYERLRLLGQGGGGRTWLARDRARDRLVVLKEPLAHWVDDEALQQRILDEARAAARVQHPNVVRCHEVVDDDGTPVIVMEYIDGGSLDEVLRSKGVLRWQRARSILLDVLQGLRAVHGAGLIHRDIKPANILLTGEGQAKIADFGIAEQQGQGDTIVETQGRQAGTPAYMAPEVAKGRPHTEASDVYACGAVLHEALYGSPPSRTPTVEAANPVPEPLRAVISKATSRDPSSRYPNAQAFHGALDSVRPG